MAQIDVNANLSEDDKKAISEIVIDTLYQMGFDFSAVPVKWHLVVDADDGGTQYD